MCYWPLPDDGRTKVAPFPLSWQRIFFRMRRNVPVGLLWLFTAPFFLAWAQSDTLNAGADSLYIIINNKIEARLAVNDSLTLERYTRNGLYHTDSIYLGPTHYYIYLSPVAARIDSLVLTDHPALSPGLKKFIYRHYPHLYRDMPAFLQQIPGWQTYESTLMRINGRPVLFIKGGYRRPPGSLALELWPVRKGAHWQLTGQFLLNTVHPLSRHGQMQLLFESEKDYRIFSYAHTFRFLGGTGWSHHYRLVFQQFGRQHLQWLHQLSAEYQYHHYRTGMGIWYHHVWDTLEARKDFYGTLSAVLQYPSWQAILQGGKGRSQAYFARFEGQWNPRNRLAGRHRIRGFAAGDTALVSGQWPRDWGWIRSHYPLGRGIAAFGDVYSIFPLTGNEEVLYVFQHFYAIVEQKPGFYSIFTLGLGLSKRKPNYHFAMEIFYPFYSNYPSDLKEFMITFKWINYW